MDHQQLKDRLTVIQEQKLAAIARQDFEQAASLRDSEREILRLLEMYYDQSPIKPNKSINKLN